MNESFRETESSANSSFSKVESLLLQGPNKLDPWVITPYHWPDLDGVACAVALEELLVQAGYRQVKAMIWQTPQIEASWVIKELGLSIPTLSLSGRESVILVDASDPADMPSFVDPTQVKIVIDHRAYHRLECFPDAVAQIEAVGAAATMIGEFFQHQSLLPTVKAATALYAGIASNTANFKAPSTTHRDLSVAHWLLGIVADGETFVQRMFLAKSDFTNLSMKEVIDRDLSSKALDVHGTPVAVAQLEVVGAEDLIRGRLEEMLISLHELKESRKAERIFLLVIDLNEDRTFFVFPDTKDRELLTPVLNLSDEGGFFAVDQTVTRKELMAKLTE